MIESKLRNSQVTSDWNGWARRKKASESGRSALTVPCSCCCCNRRACVCWHFHGLPLYCSLVHDMHVLTHPIGTAPEYQLVPAVSACATASAAVVVIETFPNVYVESCLQMLLRIIIDLYSRAYRKYTIRVFPFPLKLKSFYWVPKWLYKIFNETKKCSQLT